MNRASRWIVGGALGTFAVYSFIPSKGKGLMKPRIDPISGFDPLPLQEVDAMLTRAQRTFVGSGKGVVSRFEIGQINSNRPIEDFHAEAASGDRKRWVFGVFDGHSGTECAATVAKYLPSYVNNVIDKSLEAAGKAVRNDPAKRKQIVKEAIQNAFWSLDQDILNGSFDDFMPPEAKGSNKFEDLVLSLKPAVAGSCALVSVVDGNDLYVACTGDSRAVFGKKLPDSSYEAIALSADQTAKNPDEYGRMIEEHPNELETVIVRNRVLGGLMPTRAFGDARYKWTAEFQAKVLPFLSTRGPPRNLLSPPYVTAKPEVVHYSLDDIKDGFLVIATDGLWDMISNEDVVALVDSKTNAKPLSNSIKSSADNCATHLIRNSLAGESGNKRSEDRLCRILNIPPERSRRYRDDMTVNVIFFNNSSSSSITVKEEEKCKVETLSSDLAQVNRKNRALLLQKPTPKL